MVVRMISILFVDDEVDILAGLQNTLRKRTDEWDMKFVMSSKEALEVLANAKFDIIVSDMQMPGMDGAELLAIVQELYPHMTRFLLTGQADRQSILRTIPVTHQFIYKPCSPENLLDLLDRTCALHSRIQNEIVRRLVSTAQSVPSVPKVAARIAGLMARENASILDIAKVIESDPGLGARVLQVSNSAAMRRSRKFTNISDAVCFIGLECAKSLAMAHEVFRATPENRPFIRLLERTYSKSCLATALVTEYLEGHPEVGTATTASLLRDIGLIVSASVSPEIYRLAMDANAKSESLIFLENTCFGVTHAEIGGNLLALWGIPMAVVEAVACHHSLQDSTIEPVIMAAIHISDVIAESPNATKDEISSSINWEFLEANGLVEKANEWLEFDVQSIRIAA